MKEAGIGLTPEDRKATGLILKHSIESNLCYAGMKKTTINGWVESRKKRMEMSEKQVKALQIKLSSISAKASSMSGGSGTIYGTVVGVVLISVLINGMTILNWNIYLQYIVRGAILIGSLVLMAYRDKYRD